MDREDPGKILDYRGPQLFKNKIFLTVAGSLLFLALAGGVYSIIVLRGQTEAATTAMEQLTDSGVSEEQDLPVTAEILPQQRREHEDLDQNSWSPFDGVTDPFAGPNKFLSQATNLLTYCINANHLIKCPQDVSS